MQRILVVDDDLLVLYQLGEALEGCGYEVETAHNGYEALQKVRQRAFDAIFLDLKMPIMDAWAFYHEFQQQPGWDQTPVAMMAIDQQTSEAKKLPAQAFLQKPFRLNALLDVLEVLEARSGVRS